MRVKCLLGLGRPERHVFEQLRQSPDHARGTDRMEHLGGLVRCRWEFYLGLSEQRLEELGHAEFQIDRGFGSGSQGALPRSQQ